MKEALPPSACVSQTSILCEGEVERPGGDAEDSGTPQICPLQPHLSCVSLPGREDNGSGGPHSLE